MGSVRRWIRGRVKHYGKRLLRAVGAFQGRHSLVSDAPVLDNAEFAWSDRLVESYPRVRAELDALLGAADVYIPTFHEVSPDQARISIGDNWKTFVFRVFGERLDYNCLQCPRTAALLDSLPDLQNAWFSILEPHYHIPPHRGPTRAVVRAHLALRVPQDSDRCWLRVDDRICHWREGELLIFDDTYEHEVRNDTDDVRVVLFLDFDRPMDTVGTLVNALLLALLRMSAYVRVPLANLEALAQRARLGRLDDDPGSGAAIGGG